MEFSGQTKTNINKRLYTKHCLYVTTNSLMESFTVKTRFTDTRLIRTLSHRQRQKPYSGLRSPGRSYSTYL